MADVIHVVAPGDLGEELAGLDQLELGLAKAPTRLSRFWSAAWPKLLALVIAFGGWQALVWSHWKPDYLLPGPIQVFKALGHELTQGTLLKATGITMQRAVMGYVLAVVIATVIGVAVAQNRVVRSAIGSLITGLQTVPSAAWVPLAIALFLLSERAILFVLLVGSVPSIANGVISGVDATPPVLLHAGQVIGAKGWAKYRHIVLPAALPGFVAGLKQGWAFAWHALMAGEVIAIIAKKPSLGVSLQTARELSDYPALYASLLVIIFIGIAVDGLVFGRLQKTVLRRRGLVGGR